MSAEQLANKPTAPKPLAKMKPSVYISRELVQEIFEGPTPVFRAAETINNRASRDVRETQVSDTAERSDDVKESAPT